MKRLVVVHCLLPTLKPLTHINRVKLALAIFALAIRFCFLAVLKNTYTQMPSLRVKTEIKATKSELTILSYFFCSARCIAFFTVSQCLLIVIGTL